ncbi:MAG: O-antigen ligase family protein [Verrucomicrobiota bacterium]
MSSAGLKNGLLVLASLCLALVTLIPPASTRMWAWPWSLALAGTLTLPSIVPILRGFATDRPLVLPSFGWIALTFASAITLLLSALASPYQVSLLWAAPLLVGPMVFLLAFDWLHTEPSQLEMRRRQLHHGLLLAFAVLGATSFGLWLAELIQSTTPALELRNAHPLGHSNYTAGLALLMLPLAGATVWQQRNLWQTLGIVVALLALALLFTSGSRGGIIGLAALAFFALVFAPVAPRKKILLGVVAVIAGGVFIAANPRTRTLFSTGRSDSPLALSDIQRSAMLVASARMGLERPALGWGPGTTPLVYPRFRHGLAGGAETVLQLHSLPANLWAELGVAGLACFAAFLALLARDVRGDRIAVATFASYGAFALTDWQLDIPIFTLTLAVLAALVARPAQITRPFAPRLAAVFSLCTLGLVGLLGKIDPAPDLNLRALTLARDPTKTAEATSLLRLSLTLNPDQEIAHFNLGWLLVVADPAAAERHFLAAVHLVPDKGGVYFGLGLARLNQGRPQPAASAFALECLNDPTFLFSPWWREPAIAAQREATLTALRRHLDRTRAQLPPESQSPARAALSRIAEAAPQLGQIPPGPERTLRRERTGYPVLMRNLDLPPPVDLYDVRELVSRPAAFANLPPKGWLPSPLLLALLNEPVSPKP